MTYPPPGDWSGQQPPGQPGGVPDPTGWSAPTGGTPGPTSGVPGPQSPPMVSDPYAPPGAGPYGQPPVGPPVPGQPGQQWPGMPAPQQKSGAPVWLYIVGVVVLLVALGTGGYLAFFRGGGDEAPIDDAAGSDAPSSQQPGDDTSSAPTDTDLITDPATGLSYVPMGDPWEVSPFPAMPGGVGSPVGEMLQTEEGWVAVFLVGEMDPGALGYTGTGDLETSLNSLADVIDEVNYAPDDKQLDGLKRDGDPEFTDLEIGGYTGKIMAYHLVWDDDRIKDQSEYVGLGLIDMGDGRLAGVQLSLPESAYDTYGDAMVEKVTGMSFA